MTSSAPHQPSAPRSQSRRFRAPAIALGVIASCLIAAAALTPHLVAASASAVRERVEDVVSTSLGQPASEGFGMDDGAVGAEPMSPFDEQMPGIANLDPALRSAVQAAATDAGADGVDFYIESGWRSAAYQQALFDEAVTEHGSAEAASRLVSPPDVSMHVSGDAVDIGPTDADSWMMQHGNDYGLCQTYTNEMWHFELATTPGGECPMQLSDASVSRL